jgi:hypothetical protein
MFYLYVICINNITWNHNEEVMSFQLQVTSPNHIVDSVKFVKGGYKILKIF